MPNIDARPLDYADSRSRSHTFDNSALLGGALAIVLVVLDKLEKLHGWTLYGLLAFACLLTLPWGWSIFVTTRIKLKVVRILLSFSGIALVLAFYLLIFLWVYKPKEIVAPPPVVTKASPPRKHLTPRPEARSMSGEDIRDYLNLAAQNIGRIREIWWRNDATCQNRIQNFRVPGEPDKNKSEIEAIQKEQKDGYDRANMDGVDELRKINPVRAEAVRRYFANDAKDQAEALLFDNVINGKISFDIHGSPQYVDYLNDLAQRVQLNLH